MTQTATRQPSHNAITTADRDELLSAWNAAIVAWDTARNADWHPGKAASVAAAAKACDTARRAYYDSF